MKISILAFTAQGMVLSRKIKQLLDSEGDEVVCCQPKKRNEVHGTDNIVETDGTTEMIIPDLTTFTGRQFTEKDALIFIGACGIAVRAITPFVKAKTTDPAVLCIDEKGQYVIPLLSGHIGGANMLANRISTRIQAIPVITTATDVNKLFSVDEWASVHDAWISDLQTAKEISAHLLRGTSVGFYSELEIDGPLPQFLAKNNEPIGICVSLNDKVKPYPATLNIIPRTVYLGIGCRKGTTLQDIEAFVLELLQHHKISIHAIKGIASITLKKNEQGLRDFALKYQIATAFYSTEELLSAPGNYTESEFVRSVTGVDNVCERAAVLASAGGQLISSKLSRNGVTLALAQKTWRGSFEYSNDRHRS